MLYLSEQKLKIKNNQVTARELPLVPHAARMWPVGRQHSLIVGRESWRDTDAEGWNAASASRAVMQPAKACKTHGRVICLASASTFPLRLCFTTTLT